MRETQIIERIRKLAQTHHHDKALIQSIGDDCAILRPRRGEDLVFTTDLLIEDQHFTLRQYKAADVGHKALARSLSDLAAMGAQPVFCLVSLAIPKQLGARWIGQFYTGLLALAERHKIPLSGGDLSRSEKVIADVMCCGRVPRARAILRSGAKPGDYIYATGELGGAAHALSIGGKIPRGYLRPEPRIQAGLALRRLGVTAGMDLSDGVALDLNRLCLESGVSAELEPALPIARGATVAQALHGGEDYELLFTASPGTRVPHSINGLKVTRIGVMHSGHFGEIRFGGRPLAPEGFDHFLTS